AFARPRLPALLPTGGSVLDAPDPWGVYLRTDILKTSHPTPGHCEVQLCFPSLTSVGRRVLRTGQRNVYDTLGSEHSRTTLVARTRNDKNGIRKALSVWSGSTAPPKRWADVPAQNCGSGYRASGSCYRFGIRPGHSRLYGAFGHAVCFSRRHVYAFG